MKKLFASAVAAALAVSMTVPAFAAAGNLTAAPDKANAKQGDEVNVELKIGGVSALLAVEGIAGTGGIGSGDFVINYDPAKLTFNEEKVIDNDGFDGRDTRFGQIITDAKDSNGKSIGRISVQFFDQNARGRDKDFTLGKVPFTVNADAADGATEVTLGAPSEGPIFVTCGKTASKDDPTADIMVEHVDLVKAAVNIGTSTDTSVEPDTSTEEPDTSTEEPGTSTEEPGTSTDESGTSTDESGDTTNTGSETGTTTTTGGTTTTTTGGSSTTKPSNNNKTGDAGVLAIGGLMVLAAGATMLTLKKKSK